MEELVVDWPATINLDYEGSPVVGDVVERYFIVNIYFLMDDVDDDTDL